MMRELSDLVMPRECLVCGRPLGAFEQHLCLRCAAGLPRTYYWARPHNPMADELNALLERLRPDGAPMPYVYAAALLFYHHENLYKQIPKALKYGRDLQAGRYYASLLGKAMAVAPHWADVDAVIPVPLHWLRRWKRGYNQAGVIAAQLALALHARYLPGALRRARRTRSQTALDAGDRFRNVNGVFRPCRPAALAGFRHVLIVDDTFTTGATLAACYLALRAALGPGPRISVATLSVVED